jgi:hypothetical protein
MALLPLMSLKVICWNILSKWSTWALDSTWWRSMALNGTQWCSSSWMLLHFLCLGESYLVGALQKLCKPGCWDHIPLNTPSGPLFHQIPPQILFLGASLWHSSLGPFSFECSSLRPLSVEPFS